MEISSKSQAENGADNTTIMTPLRVKQAIKANGGGGGTTDYTALTNKPQINSITLEGNKTGAQLGLASSSDIPTKTSDLTNDGDGTHPFLLNGSPSYIDTISTYGGSSSYARNLSYTWDNGVVSESHIIANYEDIPTKVSDLQNDSGFLTSETDPVFTASAAYGITSSDITNWNAAEANVQSDWNQTDNTADDYIKNKPNITSVNDATLTIQKEGTTVGTFTANSATNATVNIIETDPVFSSSAASGITSSDITSWNGKQNTIIAGDGIDKLNDTLSLEIPTYYWDGTDTADNRAMFNEICDIYDNGGKFILYGRLLMDAGWSYNGTYTSDPRSVVVPITVTDFTSREDAGSTYYSFSSSPVYIGYRYIIGTVKATGSWGAFTKVEWATNKEDMSPARLSEVNAKQDTLVSGTNIKTINNTSLLGSGNIDIQGTVPANVAYTNVDNNFSTGQTINGNITTNGYSYINGVLYITHDGKTTAIGDQTYDYCHYSTGCSNHWFNTDVRVAGNVYGGSSYNRQLAYKDETLPLVTYTGNFNNYTESSYGPVNGILTNKPTSGSNYFYGTMLVLKHANNYTEQIAIDANTGLAYIRYMLNGTWKDWNGLNHTRKITFANEWYQALGAYGAGWALCVPFTSPYGTRPTLSLTSCQYFGTAGWKNCTANIGYQNETICRIDFTGITNSETQNAVVLVRMVGTLTL